MNAFLSSHPSPDTRSVSSLSGAEYPVSILRSEPDHREGAEGGIWAKYLSLVYRRDPNSFGIALLSSGSLRKRFTGSFAPLEDDTVGVCNYRRDPDATHRPPYVGFATQTIHRIVCSARG